MVRIYHHPRCGTSRNVLQTLLDRGLQPEIIEYVKQPWTVEALADLIHAAGLTPREALRSKESLYQELELEQVDDDRLLAAMAEHPILVNRPFVVTSKGSRLCRPAEVVEQIL